MKKQSGATMIEVLVTILILAVGLLGLSSTQMMSLKNGNNSHHRYLAALASQEMAERMRANPDGVSLGSYDDKEVDGSEAAQDCSTGCTSRQLAAMDLYDWGQVIETNLPSGNGKIVRNGDIVTFTVSWEEQHTGEDRATTDGGLDDSSFELVVEL
ncbi:type IV pilus modification protein PilV [Microbulbifer halophilus]|uniref:Type IV pilus modification protein PilV n=1 Tax=Microbulbifer halophilus TaxID=453963 RepID=A0ABW5E5D2_9GAMM|nr:type IV pilus modification protein PilV [Microbulbifer halophilus]MCW8127494.1 type IV pilus modification protein PilV [Microbulbifer halophilus]